MSRFLKKESKPVLVKAVLVGLVVVFTGVHFFLKDSFGSEDVRHTKHNLAVNPDILAGEGNDFVPGGLTSLRGARNPEVRGIEGDIRLNEEVCIFCHTPHGGRSNVGGVQGIAPLWNRRISSPMAYTPYNSPHFDAQDMMGAPGRPKGVSLACLSCHDGAVAFDALINSSGSGGFFPRNKTFDGPGGSIGMGFSGPAVDAANSFREGRRAEGDGGFVFFDQFGSGPNASFGAEPFPNLGLDLRDDHPISMEIPRTDPQFKEILTNITTKGGRIPGSGGVMWIDRDPNGANLPLDKRDRIRAYASDPSRPDAPYIECASCHNPHEASRPGGQPILSDPVNAETINNSLFLRLASRPNPDSQDRNSRSLICLSCHKK
ncbi:MAG: hypothetical protein ACE5F7_07990 [Nitrospiria bacterium]